MPTAKFIAALFCLCAILTACANEQQTAATDYMTEETIARSNTTSASSPGRIDTTQHAEQISRSNNMYPDSTQKVANAPDTSSNPMQSAISLEAKATKVSTTKKEEEKELEQKAARAKKRAERKKAEKGHPEISFKETVHNYGRITQGDKVTYDFVFTNTGDKDLVISNAKATCGCTQPSFPFIPIAPGEQGYIGVVFNSKGKLGRQKPMITITTNAQPTTYEIFLEGYVDSSDSNQEKDGSM